MWNPNRPLNELPETVRQYYLEHAEYLYRDLYDNRLTVILIPAPKPMHPRHMIRTVQSQNPEWYSDLYWSHSSFRRDRSLRALNRIRKQEDRPFIVSPYKYDSIYRGLIHDNLLEGYTENGFSIPPNNDVRLFFDLEEVIIESCLE